jgi:hypothetical protein
MQYSTTILSETWIYLVKMHISFVNNSAPKTRLYEKIAPCKTNLHEAFGTVGAVQTTKADENSFTTLQTSGNIHAAVIAAFIIANLPSDSCL